MMNDGEVHEYIIENLASHTNRDDIVFELCHRYNLNWAEAEALVAEVEEERKGDIEKRQTPLLAIIAIGLMVVGLALIGYGVYNLFAFWQTMATEPAPPPADRTIVEQMIDNIIKQYQVANDVVFVSTIIPYAVQIILLGVTMVMGSYFGMKQVWNSIFEYFGI